MRYIKLALISIVILSLVLTVLSLLIPPHLHIARNENISSSSQRIHSIINDLHTWTTWNQFVSDSVLTGIKISDNGEDLESDQLQILLQKDSMGSIQIIWNPHKGKMFTGGFKLMNLTPGNMTVQWYFDFTFGWYPWQKFTSLVYDKQLQPTMEKSLDKLKRLVENNP
jgi:hypothetical protein